MERVVRYVVVFERVGGQQGTPILVSGDQEVVSEVAQIIAERVRRPLGSKRFAPLGDIREGRA